MGFCVTSRQKEVLLDKADEILVAYKDIEQITDLGYEYNKPIILDIPKQEYLKINWDELDMYNILTRNNLVLKLHNFEGIKTAKDHKIKFYVDYPLSSFEEIQEAVDNGFEYIRVNDTLFFSMDLVQTYNIKVRINPLGSDNHYLKNKNPIVDTWVRPEDIGLYDNCIIEFLNLSLEKEEAMYNLYSKKHEWNFNLDLLIDSMSSYKEVLNPLIVNDFGSKRFSCGKRCTMPNKDCHYCDLALTTASMKSQIKEYKDNIYNT